MEAYKIFENESAIVILDKNPMTQGHTLVIPKQHHETLTDLDSATVGELFETARNVTEAIERALHPSGVNILQSNGERAGQEIPHVHVHVVPRYEEDRLEIDFTAGSIEDHNPEKLVQYIAKELD